MLRCAALGDLMFALPALSSLRNAYPQAEIVLLGEPWHQDFLLNRPGPVNRVVPVPGGLGAVHRGEDFPAQEQFFEQMRAERFDVAIQLFGGGRHSNPFILRLGAGLTVGAKAPESAPLDRWIPYIYYQSETFRCLEVCSLLGLHWTHPEAELAVTDKDRREADEVAPSGPLAAIHPGAGAPERRWQPEKFAAVADGLVRAGATAVITGTSKERDLVSAVLEGMKEEAFEVCGRLTLGGLAGLLSRCAVVVSNDSGPLYLAAAAGAPTVGIYWCGNLINGAPASRARHRPVISWRLDCPTCGANCMETQCEHQPSFVDKVTVEEVLDQALDLFRQERQDASGDARRGR
ncbi:MAG TPA: glycosyltransferase family 9 protein [Actinomycetota bacterium]|nr:glycosyltransferase family 9 protein [Actinomycetota bacterium]